MNRPSELADLIERLIDAIPFISEKDDAEARAAVASLRAEPSQGAPGGAEHCPRCIHFAQVDSSWGLTHGKNNCPGLRQRGPSREALMELYEAISDYRAWPPAATASKWRQVMDALIRCTKEARCAREETAHD